MLGKVHTNLVSLDTLQNHTGVGLSRGIGETFSIRYVYVGIYLMRLKVHKVEGKNYELNVFAHLPLSVHHKKTLPGRRTASCSFFYTPHYHEDHRRLEW